MTATAVHRHDLAVSWRSRGYHAIAVSPVAALRSKKFPSTSKSAARQNDTERFPVNVMSLFVSDMFTSTERSCTLREKSLLQRVNGIPL